MLRIEVRSLLAAGALALVVGLLSVAVLGSGVATAQEAPEPKPETGERTVDEDPDGRPQPTLFGDVNTLDDLFDALDEADLGPLALQEIAVMQPWIAVASAGVLVLEGAQVEVYALSVVEAEEAIGNLSGENASFQPPANVTIWRGLEFILILRDAPANPTVEALISNIVGSPALLTIAGPLPPPVVPGSDDDASTGPVAIEDPPAPEALPATGSGGVADGGTMSALAIAVLAVVGGSLGLVMTTLAVRRRGLRLR